MIPRLNGFKISNYGREALSRSNSEIDPLQGSWQVLRRLNRPIIDEHSHSSIGVNIQGPSLIRVPEWIPNPLGQYYLYFADHKGRYIRLAYADHLIGPWSIHVPGSLQLEQSHFPTSPVPKPKSPIERDSRPNFRLPHDREYEAQTPHIASPDVHFDDDNRQIVMYFHGLKSHASQVTCVAYSLDGINFRASEKTLCPPYLRVVPTHRGLVGMTMPGTVYLLSDWETGFEPVAELFNKNFRHHAMLPVRNWLFVFWTQVGEAPECIKVSLIDLDKPLHNDNVVHYGSLMRPELPWEGSEAPLEPSVRSVAYGRLNQLRDPAIFVEDNEHHLLYAGGGESGIGLARLAWSSK